MNPELAQPSSPSDRLSDDLARAQPLLKRAGLDPAKATLQPIPGGRNNRVYLASENNAQYLLKSYFTHPDDRRDRLGAEWAFSQALWQSDVRCLPEPMAADNANHVALFEWIDGRPFMSPDMSNAYVDDALQFMVTIQSLRNTSAAQEIKPASEACFSMDEHVMLVARRLQTLASIDVSTDLHQCVVDWMRDELLPRWEDQLRTLANHMGDSAFEPITQLPKNQRCLSPSDFGFHNVLLRDQQLVFLDFEYAGWDDPAKLVCDFFCQPQIPVPIDRFDNVARSLIECLLGSEASAQTIERERLRYHLLLPIYQIKWCCILLNEFLPLGRARREHANQSGSASSRMSDQFNSARQLFRMIPAAAA